jgi:uncharacterized protein YneF (UPF0154 family)
MACMEIAVLVVVVLAVGAAVGGFLFATQRFGAEAAQQ